MTLLEMLAEWHKGCSDASPEHPEDCPTCTRALIDAIERRATVHQGVPRGALRLTLEVCDEQGQATSAEWVASLPAVRTAGAPYLHAVLQDLLEQAMQPQKARRANHVPQPQTVSVPLDFLEPLPERFIFNPKP